MRRLATLCALVFCIFAASVPARAQAPTGRIVGRIVDATTGAGIAEVGIQVVGTTIGTTSGVDGRFTLASVPAGTVTLQARRLGFASKTVTGLILDGGKTLDQSIALAASSVQLAAQVVTASKERGTVNDALDAQRSSVGVVNSVTAEQISKSPDGDAAQAVKRVSGATVQDGKHVFVRGLGERYTTASLNNARIPSPEPEKRVVPLDMFPAGLLQTITISKTFTPDQSGDFSGAQVDIKTKEFPASRTGSLQVGSGYADGATGSNVLAASSVGGESFAMVNHQRDLPSIIRNLGNLASVNLSQGDHNTLINSFRDSWTPKSSTGSPLMNGSASFGGNDPVLFGHRVGYLVSGTISSGTDVKDGQIRALADRATTRGETIETDKFTGQTASQSVLWGGLTNISTLLGEGSRLSFNGLFNRSADNDARVETGEFTSEALPVKITRMQYTERAIFSGQLAGEHQITESQKFDWAATASGVRRYEPDRTEFVQDYERDTPNGPQILRWYNGGTGGAVRTFSDLNENNHEYSAKYQLNFGPAGSQSLVKIGGLYRVTSRDAQSLSYAFSGTNMTNAQRELPMEQIFDGRFTGSNANTLHIAPLSQGGSYTANDHLRAGFVMAEVPLSSALRLVGGTRYEEDKLEVDAFSTIGSPVYTNKLWKDLLPSLALNVKLSETQQLRFSGSRTLARPEYRELSPIISRDVIGGENVRGDESLQRTNVNNADVRWEMYPSAGEMFSIGLFAKHFILPIERVYGSGSGGTSFVFFTNAKSADNYGVELEVRKDLGAFARRLEPLSVFTNVTVMRSQIHLFDSTQAAATNLSRAMVGQAPYVFNAGLTYAAASTASTATLLFNRVGERITAAGSSPLPDVIEQPRNVLDFSLRQTISSKVTLRFDLKNLLDSPYDVEQGTVTREFYRSGRLVNLGFLWRP
ncbi:MAG: TonB-dependent receptor [Gemmatimonadetes bacterium]|nr:TonB-dependent receptor [Gemmatimonadota bacterium]